VPDWGRNGLNDWLAAAAIDRGKLFRRVNKFGKIWGAGITEKAVWHIVIQTTEGYFGCKQRTRSAVMPLTLSSRSSEQRYYDGVPPEIMRFGSAWPGANFQLVDRETEIAPDIHLISLISDKPGTLELRELSLAINTPEGMAIVVGCSHPGIDKIVAAAAAINPHINVVAGGFHLVVSSDADIEKIVTAMHDTFKVEYVAPGHCTGEPAFAALKKAFGDRYIYAGLGTTLELLHASRN
jgi:hypothetical protein